MSNCADKPNFLEFWVQNGQNDLEGKGQSPPFPIPTESIRNTCLVQIWWFQLKSVMSYADKVKLTDGQMDRRTNAGNDNTSLAWKVKG